MATKLTRPVTREVTGLDGRTDYQITLASQGILIRRKGTRAWFGPYPYGGLYTRAAELHANAERAAKRARRTTRNLLKER